MSNQVVRNPSFGGGKVVRSDYTGSIFFQNQLQYMQSRVYEYQYAPLLAFEAFPINYDIPAGAKQVSAVGLQSVGRARRIESYADDLPEAGIRGMQIMNPIENYGVSYRYSYEELRNAEYAGVDLPYHQGVAARLAMDQKFNDIAFFGEPDVGMYGAINNPAVPLIPIPADGVGGSTEWSTKDAAQIIRDLNLVVNSIYINSNTIERANAILLPPSQYALISSMRANDLSSESILSYFEKTHPEITFIRAAPQLDGAGTNGTDVMLAYDRSPLKLQMQIAMPFTQHPPQERNLEFVINCEAKFGGMSFYFPTSAAIAEGI